MKISGVEIHIEEASFAGRLGLKALWPRLEGSKTRPFGGVLGYIKKKDAAGNIDVGSTDLSGLAGIATTIFNLLLGPACSDEVEAAAMECAKKCYTEPGKEKMTRNSFSRKLIIEDFTTPL